MLFVRISSHTVHLVIPCLQASGQYACCPLPKAVCCEDQIHCCPQGYTCDTSQGTCIKEKTVIQANLVKSTQDKSVICPSANINCSDGQTCCLSSSGNYQCCPFENAVCCEDKIHCCPAGSKCDISEGICLNTFGYRYVPMLKKTPPMRTNNTNDNLKDIICPDKKSECLSGTTCCLLRSGEYGCCPFPEATCCDDKIHCCPNGYKCDAASGMCMRSSSNSFSQSALRLN